MESTYFKSGSSPEIFTGLMKLAGILSSIDQRTNHIQVRSYLLITARIVRVSHACFSIGTVSCSTKYSVGHNLDKLTSSLNVVRATMFISIYFARECTKIRCHHKNEVRRSCNNQRPRHNYCGCFFFCLICIMPEIETIFFFGS
jgi:hypothetical protein